MNITITIMSTMTTKRKIEVEEKKDDRVDSDERKRTNKFRKLTEKRFG
jgi:hypothetical protein